MRLEQDDNKPKVNVVIKVAQRDPKTQRIVYKTHDSFNVVETTPEEVTQTILKAFGGGKK